MKQIVPILLPMIIFSYAYFVMRKADYHVRKIRDTARTKKELRVEKQRERERRKEEPLEKGYCDYREEEGT